jgi:hypothetical protein
MNHLELMGLIDRIISNIKTDYSTIEFYTKELHKNLGDKHLDWSLAHMSTSMLELIRDLQRHQDYLNKDKNAS